MGDPPTFLLRYGEIGIKSLPVRRRFERLLAANIVRSLKARGVQGKVQHTWGRLFLEAPDAPAREVLARTFGLVSFSPVVEAPAALPGLAAFVGRAAQAIPDRATFAVRARRSGEVGYTSMDAARALGTAILEAQQGRGLRVDLGEPAVEVVVEVRDGRAWVGLETLPGPGGLPVGSEGRVVAWLGSTADALAAWMAMKRGCRVDLLGPASQEGLARTLADWDAALTLTEVPHLPARPGRALVLALLGAHARRRAASAVVVGDGFREALQLAPLDRALGVPVFRPLLALEPAMLGEAARHLGVAVPGEGPAAQTGDAATAAQEAETLLKAARTRKVLA